MPLFKFNFSDKSVDYCSLRLSLQPLFEFFTEEGPELIYVEYAISPIGFYFEVAATAADVEFSIQPPVLFFDILVEEADEARLYLELRRQSFLFTINQEQFADIELFLSNPIFNIYAYTQEELFIKINMPAIGLLFEAIAAETNIIDFKLQTIEFSFELYNESVTAQLSISLSPLVSLCVNATIDDENDDESIIKFEYLHWHFVDDKSIDGVINDDDIISFHNRG